ncbi:MAG TPA: Na+/H+ antiporter subunit E [Noviherbaspirillum sp.]
MQGKQDQAGIHAPGALGATCFRAALFAGLWWILSDGSFKAWVLGAATVALATAASLHLRPPRARRLSVTGLLAFLLYFIGHSVRGGVQVALLAIRPRMDLRPALYEVPLTLADESDRMIVAGMVALMPGTLSAGLTGNCLHLHVLDRRLPAERDVRLAEERVKRLFHGGGS